MLIVLILSAAWLGLYETSSFFKYMILFFVSLTILIVFGGICWWLFTHWLHPIVQAFPVISSLIILMLFLLDFLLARKIIRKRKLKTK